MKTIFMLTAATFLSACDKDETLTAFGASDHTWILQSIDGTAYTATANLTFPEEGQIAGQAPCNRFFGTLTAPYPWFATGPLATTRRACPALAQEGAFLSALKDMSLAEIKGTVLILSNDQGREMVFNAAPG